MGCRCEHGERDAIRHGAANDNQSALGPSRAGAPSSPGGPVSDLEGGTVWVGDAIRRRTVPARRGGSTSHQAGIGRRACAALAAGSDAIWAASAVSDAVYVVDPHAARMRTPVDVGKEGCDAPSAVAVGSGGVWVACSMSQEVIRIDPALYAVTASARGRGARRVGDGRARRCLGRDQTPVTGQPGGSIRSSAGCQSASSQEKGPIEGEEPDKSEERDGDRRLTASPHIGRGAPSTRVASIHFLSASSDGGVHAWHARNSVPPASRLLWLSPESRRGIGAVAREKGGEIALGARKLGDPAVADAEADMNPRVCAREGIAQLDIRTHPEHFESSTDDRDRGGIPLVDEHRDASARRIDAATVRDVARGREGLPSGHEVTVSTSSGNNDHPDRSEASNVSGRDGPRPSRNSRRIGGTLRRVMRDPGRRRRHADGEVVERWHRQVEGREPDRAGPIRCLDKRSELRIGLVPAQHLQQQRDVEDEVEGPRRHLAEEAVRLGALDLDPIRERRP